jgi:hypothetical protein
MARKIRVYPLYVDLWKPASEFMGMKFPAGISQVHVADIHAPSAKRADKIGRRVAVLLDCENPVVLHYR